MADGFQLQGRHGKSRVRVSRVWRRPAAAGGDIFVEWNVAISVVSDCLPSYISDDNSAIVATDSIKNTVRSSSSFPLSSRHWRLSRLADCVRLLLCRCPGLDGERLLLFPPRRLPASPPPATATVVRMLAGVVKHHSNPLTPRPQQSPYSCARFAANLCLALELMARQVTVAWSVSEATVTIVERPWERVVVDGKPHSHGFKAGVEKHTTEVIVKKSGSLLINSGIQGYSLLKTTQLPSKPFCFTQRYQDVKKVLAQTFFGPPDVGVYSPSVQNTLYLMAKEVLSRFPDISSVQLRMPNLHFLPVNLSSKENPGLVKFADDVYLPTDEPHGTIEATVSRAISKL
ncbi:hypothetical protein PR202_gb04107 [Eleusine coracana subsp. coracana]|uniref:Uricase n=1 Tax=Eleusine coracana subsp. coracana TaxID=191504 RepID=A0AAV5E183_ELECO|nr:hypothetical protein PR202_gb04107 [Eleusine coracana subsp. coracana]